MRRDGRVGAGVTARHARFDRVVEFVNFLLALVMMAAAWVLVVEVLAWSERRDHLRR